jgi:xanthine dehydrogenase YagS FAD-binding subunit
MHPFQYLAVSDLKRAVDFLKDPQAAVLAGGTDLLGELKRRIRNPQLLVSIKSLGQLAGLGVERKESGPLRMGALVTIAEIEKSPLVAEKFPSLRQAASFVASPQLRNMGTVGGNLCQHPRCWYFRSSLFPCWLKGGQKCFAVAGENRLHRILGTGVCHSVHPSDLAPVLIALDAKVKVAGPKPDREFPLENLYMLPKANQRQTTVLNPGELITEVRVPFPPPGSRGVFLKAMDRKAWAFALSSIALQVRMEGARVLEGRMVLGGVAPIPWRAKEAEEVLGGQELSDDLARRTEEAALAGMKPMRDNHYKAQLVRSLVRRALAAVWQDGIKEKS